MGQLTENSNYGDYNKLRDPKARWSFCHAPMTNLNFSQTGEVTACCYNRNFILGTYPKNSLKEIWFGQRTNQLRKYLKENDLSHGCHLCSEQLKARNYSGLYAAKFEFFRIPLRKETEKGFLPATMEFELGNTCNLECVMCNGYFSSAIRRHREKLEPIKSPYDDAFVEQLRDFIPTLIEARFLGGEPFLNPIYPKIWALIAETNPSVRTVITTNGTIFNSKIESLLHILKPWITVSCDTFDERVYEEVRINGKYKVVRKNILEFLRIAKITKSGISISACPMRQTWPSLPEMVRFCDENGISINFNTMVWPPQYSIKTLPKREIAEIIGYLEARGPAETKAIDPWWSRYNYEKYQGLLNQLRFWSQDKPLSESQEMSSQL